MEEYIIKKDVNIVEKKNLKDLMNNITKKFFDQCETPTALFHRGYAEHNEDWNMVAQTYAKYEKYLKPHARPFLSALNYKIPPVIHFIWLGSELPQRYAENIEDWRSQTGFEVKVWGDKEAEQFLPTMMNKELFKQSSNYGIKSDLLRYEILYTIGGLYIDTDFLCCDNNVRDECLKFDEIHRITNFWCGICLECPVQVNNGIMASCKNHPILKLCIDNARLDNPWQITCPQTLVLYQTGPWLLTGALLYYLHSLKGVDLVEDDDVLIFPSQVFHPFPAFYRDKPELMKDYIKPHSLAVHLWNASWQENSPHYLGRNSCS